MHAPSSVLVRGEGKVRGLDKDYAPARGPSSVLVKKGRLGAWTNIMRLCMPLVQYRLEGKGRLGAWANIMRLCVALVQYW